MKRLLPLVSACVALALLAAVGAALAPWGAAPAATAASPAAKDAADRNNGFAADLYARLNQAHADQNLFLSPYSISAALGMTAQGARGQTADQMNKVLHIGPDFQAGMAEITRMLNPGKAPFELSVANGLWVDQKFPLVGGFVADCRKNYGTGVIGVDFLHNAEGARVRINTAIAGQTHDKIQDLIPTGGVDSHTALVLTNAIYFKGRWEHAFPKDLTKDQPFHAAGGQEVTVPLMSAPETTYAYGETEDAQMLALPYQGAAGGAPTLTMLVILPKKADGLAGLERAATADHVAQWAAGLRQREVVVYLPRFKMTTEYELSGELRGLGMTEAFAGTADFSGISAPTDDDRKFFLLKVLHKAFVEVNEEGTEAAAATAVITYSGATATPPQRIEFRADHPFLFLIRHEPTGSILFMGRLNNPT